MSPIDAEYLDLVRAMPPHERIARCTAALHWVRQTIARQIVAERGPVPEEELKWLVALRLYQSDPGALELIRKAMAGHAST